MVETKTNRKIKVLRSDRGREYNSEEFDAFCQNEGLQKQYTLSCTSQQNMVVEIKNRVILENIRVMLIGKDMLKSLWATIVAIATNLHNRTPTIAINIFTPKEAYSGKNLHISHLIIFICISYVKILDENIYKLDDKAIKCMFIGYLHNKKGYKCWDPKNHKVFLSKDLIYFEIGR